MEAVGLQLSTWEGRIGAARRLSGMGKDVRKQAERDVSVAVTQAQWNLEMERKKAAKSGTQRG